MKTASIKTAERYVYLADAGNGVFKIGWSRQPIERVNFLSATESHGLVLLHQVRTKHATLFESYLKRRYQAKRIRGEWFKLDPADVEHICEFTSESVDAMSKETLTEGQTRQIRVDEDVADMADRLAALQTTPESTPEFLSQFMRPLLKRELSKALDRTRRELHGEEESETRKDGP